MKAIICGAYGTPDVLQLREIEKPIPKENQILIKVHASVVSPADCAFRKGEPFIVRLIYGLTKPKIAIQGVELAGEVEAIGNTVTLFKKGDQIFGISSDTFGAHAEYICLPETATVIHKVATMTYEDAVGICDGALTALIFLRDEAKIQAGRRILINGASGAVGAYAVQLAKYYGAHITGVCSAANIGLVRSLGADCVIDYTKEDFTRSNQSYDIIFDAIGKSSFSRCKRVLASNGIYLSTVPTLGIMLHMLWTSKIGSKKAIFTAAGLRQNTANLNYLKTLFEAGKLQAVIDRRYPLEQISEAHRYVDKGHKKGSVIIAIGHI